MKPPFARNTGIAAVVLCGLLAAGCGQPGPLYLPKPPTNKVQKPSVPPELPPPSTPTTAPETP